MVNEAGDWELKEGWLFKLGKTHKVWRKRWCCFAAGHLVYFVSPGAAEKGSIDLSEVLTVRVENSQERGKALVLCTATRDWWLSPMSGDELQSWHDAIVAMSSRLRSDSITEVPSEPLPSPSTLNRRAQRVILEELPLTLILRPHHVDSGGDGALLEVLLRRESFPGIPLSTPISYRFVATLPGRTRARKAMSRIELQCDPVEGTILIDTTHLIIVRPVPSRIHGNLDTNIELYIWPGTLDDVDKQPTKQVLFALVPVQLRGVQLPPPPPPPPSPRTATLPSQQDDVSQQ